MKEITPITEEFIKFGTGDKRHFIVNEMIKNAYVDTGLGIKVWTDIVAFVGGKRAWDYLIMEYMKLPYTKRNYQII